MHSHLRPDPIDQFAPDARRELFKGLVVDVLACRDNKLFIRADLWRPIAFTSVSRMDPLRRGTGHSVKSSLIEDYLHVSCDARM